MATIQIHCAEHPYLPPVCAKCGATATDLREEEFTYQPLWLPLLTFVISPLIVWLTWKATIPLPVCDEHRRDKWTFLQKLLLGLALASILAGILGFYLMTSGQMELGENLMAAAFGTSLALMIPVFYLCESSFSATHISKTTVTVKGLCKEFVEALDERRGQYSSSGPNNSTGQIELQTAKYYRG